MPRAESRHINPALNRRSFLAGLAGLAGLAALSGCRDGDPSERGSAGSGAARFKIGVIGPLTGDNASYGTSVANGSKLGAIDFSDATCAFEVRAEDDVADPEASVNAFNTLADWGMQALVGPTTTGSAVAVSSEAADARTFMLTPSATSSDVTADKNNVFQVCFTDPAQGANAAKFIAAHFADEKMAVFYRDDDSYSQGIADAFLAQAKTSGLSVVENGLTFTKSTQSDFKVQLTTAQNAGATMIFAPVYYTPASVLLTQAHEMGFPVKIFGVDGMDGILGVENFDKSLAEGVYLLTPFSVDDERNVSFVDAYKKKFGSKPDQFAADAYDAIHAIREAIAHARIAIDAPAEDACDALVKAMTEIEIDGVTGKLSWKRNGQVSKEPTAFVIQDGRYVAVS